MVCLGLKPGVAEWKVQTNPLSHGGTPNNRSMLIRRRRGRQCSEIVAAATWKMQSRSWQRMERSILFE